MLSQKYLLRFEYLKKNPLITREFTSHDNYEIYYFHHGKGYFLIGDKAYSLKPGTIVLLDGMTLHSPHCLENTPYVRTTIDFDPILIRSITNNLFRINPLNPFERFGHCTIQLNEHDKVIFENMLEKVYECFLSNDVTAYDRFKLSFIDVLFYIYEIFEKSGKLQNQNEVSDDPLISKVIAYIEQNYMNDIQLDHLSKELFVNKYYLARLFREVTGMTIFTYLYKRRINQAKIFFLIYPDKSITDICFLVGFKNRSHFGRVFKKIENITPERFRDALRKEIDANRDKNKPSQQRSH